MRRPARYKRALSNPLARASCSSQTLPVSEFQFGGEFVWHPTPEIVAQSNLQRFIEKHELGSYSELMQRSTTNIAWFWDTVLGDLDIQFYKPYSRVVDLSEGKPWARWCVDGEMNIVHNMLDKYAGTEIDNRLAIKSETEDGTARTVTYKSLREQTNRMAAALRSKGSTAETSPPAAGVTVQRSSPVESSANGNRLETTIRRFMVR
jgi:acetyl-CoA synthetase